MKSHSGQFPQGTVLFFMRFHFGPHFSLTHDTQDSGGMGMEVAMWAPVMFLRVKE